MTFGEKLTKIRKEKGWSQTDLAEHIGVHTGHISRIENDKALPSIEILKKIKMATGISADYLLDDDVDEMTPVEIKDKSLAEKLMLIDQLSDKDKSTITNVIESMLTKKKMLDVLTKEEAELEHA